LPKTAILPRRATSLRRVALLQLSQCTNVKLCDRAPGAINVKKRSESVRACHDTKTVTAGNKGIFFVPLIYLWVN
jgi:hypothetical protein